MSRTQLTQQLPVPSSQTSDGAVPLCKKIASRLQSLRPRRNGRKHDFEPLPEPSRDRLDASLSDAPIDADKLPSIDQFSIQEKEKTVLYLAYGSNLCKETFRGVRGIRPLSQVNVLVPSLRLTFDLPGVPYSEPCFANTALRTPNALPPQVESNDYHKDRWHKGLVGVVYEVTLTDYAHIIATEGGGSAYHDILVDCYVLPKSDTVPSIPTSAPFKAHTLFAPIVKADGVTRTTDRNTRPDPSYAQPSARYLKLITDGATECELPTEYQDYLHGIRPYTITTKKQAVGKVLFLSIWMPFIMLVFSLARQLQDDKGKAPKWLAFLTTMVFKGVWVSYDGVFKKVFGDGERTIGDEAMKKRVKEVGAEAEKEGLLEKAVDVLDIQAVRRKSVLEGWSDEA